MGKRIVIAGADFSANGIASVTSLLSYVKTNGTFEVGYGLASFVTIRMSTAAPGRCALGPINLSNSGYTLSDFSKVRVTFKAGIEFVCGSGPSSSSATNWQGWKGTTGGFTFANGWDDEHSFAEFPTDTATPLFISLNFRKADGSDFATSTTIDDLVDDIELIP